MSGTADNTMKIPSRRAFLQAAGAAAVTAAVNARGKAGAASDGDTPVPVSGDAVAGLEPFDELMTGFLREHDVPGASLAVSRAGRVVYARGFGVAERGTSRAVGPGSLFRIASIAKPLTAVAVLQLVEQKKIALDEPILGYLPPDLRNAIAAEGARDERLGAVTVRHCLQHRGGWDRDKSGDPIAIPTEVAAALKVPFPVTPAAVVRYALGKRLDFEPDADFAYSNVGYLMLGRAIETAGGMGYEEYVRSRVLAPLGITSMRLNRALPEDRPAEEVAYFDRRGRTAPCVYPPKVGQIVPLADGAMNVEAFQAHGGWVATAADLVRFACALDDPDNCPLLSASSIETMFARPDGKAGHEDDGSPKAAYYGCGWMVRPVAGTGKANHWHSGLLLPGTSTLLVRRWDGLNWAVLFNTDSSGSRDGKGGDGGSGDLAGLIDPLLHKAAAEVRDWPVGGP